MDFELENHGCEYPKRSRVVSRCLEAHRQPFTLAEGAEGGWGEAPGREEDETDAEQAWRKEARGRSTFRCRCGVVVVGWLRTAQFRGSLVVTLV